jgi:lipoprotein signal peptidase
MFQFDAYWPSWMPWLGGEPVFPAIWNVADSCISVGVGLMILINRKNLFSFKKDQSASETN